MDVSLLHNRGERLLGHAPGLQKSREIAAPAQLGDAQFDRAGARFPDPVAIAVAVIEAVGTALAVRGAGHTLDLQLHQPLRGKTHHLAQQLGIRTLLQQHTKAHHLVGHRRVLGPVQRFATKPYWRPAMTTAVDK